jgi:hypothetical protein
MEPMGARDARITLTFYLRAAEPDSLMLGTTGVAQDAWQKGLLAALAGSETLARWCWLRQSLGESEAELTRFEANKVGLELARRNALRQGESLNTIEKKIIACRQSIETVKGRLDELRDLIAESEEALRLEARDRLEEVVGRLQSEGDGQRKEALEGIRAVTDPLLIFLKNRSAAEALAASVRTLTHELYNGQGLPDRLVRLLDRVERPQAPAAAAEPAAVGGEVG